MTHQHWERPFSPPEAGWSPVGYAHLVDLYRLEIVGRARWLFTGTGSSEKHIERPRTSYSLLPARLRPGSRAIDHLIFAFRREGPDLEICRSLFRAAQETLAQQIVEEVENMPTSAFRRRIWFLWEAFSGRRLPLPAVDQGNYIPFLDPDLFVVGPTVRKVRRQRIDLNLLGPLELAPVVRRTARVQHLLQFESSRRLQDEVQKLFRGYDQPTIRRALSFLYTRETRASFEIESERPSRTREDRFVALLRRAPGIVSLDEPTLVELQTATVDSRFANVGWRETEIYVGEALGFETQRIHYIGPRAEDLPSLMRSFLSLSDRLMACEELDPLISAALISFLFVFLHPFNDGNGRLHRWLIRWGLVRKGVTPAEVVIPISAVLQARRTEYDEILETFSVPLMRLVDYSLDDQDRMTIHGETLDFYRYPDLTPMVEALVRWLEIAVREELAKELDFLVSFDGAKAALQRIVDMPDRLLVLFIKFCRQGHGALSARKRAKFFAELTDSEVRRMEEIVREHFEAPRSREIEERQRFD